MTTVNASTGFQSSLGIDTANPITLGFDFESETFGMEEEIVDTSGLRGSRSHRSERTRQGLQRVGGGLELFPSREDLQLLLPWFLGTDVSGTTYALADTVQSRYITIDRKQAVYTYDGCCVNRVTFSGSEGQPIKVSIDCIGKTETSASAGSFPSATYQNKAPFMFMDSVLTIGGTGYPVKNWSVTLNNFLDVKFYNSVTATAIDPRDREVSFNSALPFNSATLALYNALSAGAASSLVLTNAAGKILTFSFAALQVPAKSPEVPGRSEILLPINGISRMLSTTKELIITLT